MVRLLAFLLAVALTASACQGGGADEAAAATAVPRTGLCRMLSASQVEEPSNRTAAISCSQPHDSETFAAGSLPARFDHAAYDDPTLATWAYGTCARAFPAHLGTDESTAMRSVLTWIWFRPTEQAWKAGARWYRCDLLGGSASQGKYVDLPTTTKGLLSGRGDDHWMACAKGRSVASGTTVPCTMPHDWRAATTIKLGEAGTRYPGDAAAKARTRAYCSESIDAWLGYPTSYDFGFTWFGDQQWRAGNRRSVCWAGTNT